MIPNVLCRDWPRHWPDCTWEEVGFESLHRLFHRIADRDGSPPPVMFSGDLLDDPGGTARAYCAAVGIPFVAEALEWEAGERSEVSWYGGGAPVRGTTTFANSTGIAKPTTEYAPLTENPRLHEMYERALPLFDDLRQYAFAPAS